MILRDAYGWPVELIRGRPLTNFFRRILVTNWYITWCMRKKGWPKQEPDPNVGAAESPLTTSPDGKEVGRWVQGFPDDTGSKHE